MEHMWLLHCPAVPHLGPTCSWLEGSCVTVPLIYAPPGSSLCRKMGVESLALYEARKNQTCPRNFGKWDEEGAKDFSKKKVTGQCE